MDSEGDMKKNDPYRAIRESEKQDIKPGFLGGNDVTGRGLAYKGNNIGKNKEAKIDNAVKDLKFAEDSAKNSDLNQSEDSLVGNRKNESEARGFYSGEGRGFNGRSGDGKDNKKRRGVGILKKGGPVGVIFAIILGVGGLIGGTQLFQPFSLVAQFQETFNSMQVSANLRSKKFFSLQMENGRVKNPVRGTVFGKTFKITDKQNEKLKRQGIEFDEDFNGKKVLKFDDGSGEIKIVAADAKTAKSLGNISGVDATTGKAYSATAISFDDIYSSDVNFHQAYNNGSLTWRGQIANWFGTRMKAFLDNNKLTRNLFSNYENKKAELDGDGMAAVKDILEAKTDMIDDGGEKVREMGEDDKGGFEQKGDSDLDSSKMVRGDVNELNTKMENIKNKFSSSANWICGISNAVGAVTLMVQAAEALQIINLATSYFETVDKVKAGQSDDAPINELAMTLNEKKTNVNRVLTDIVDVGNDNYKATFDDVTSEKTAMQSEGIAALYSGGMVDTTNASVQSFNLTSSIKSIMGGIGVSMAAFQTCTIAKLAISAIQFGITLKDFAECLVSAFTAETGAGAVVAVKECADFIRDILWPIIKGAVIGATIAGVFSAIAPMLISAWTRDLVSDIGGEDLGNALASGGNMYLGGAHKANGGSPATIGEYEKYAVLQQQIIADNARYEREGLSPFDLTSKYTFMGTLMTQLSSFISSDSLMSIITSSSSAVSSSILALSPAASAYDIKKTLPEDEKDYEKTCPYLASIGAIGDAYCNPYMITDVSTVDYDPVDVIKRVNDLGGLKNETTSDGNVVINGDSDLAKYVRYCDGRNSMLGIADYNIVSDINSGTSANTGNNYLDGAIDGAIGSIPAIGDGIDIIENSRSLGHIGYISGESCVAGNEVNAAESPNWEEAKYYQRFIEDQSLAESMGEIEESAVTAYLREYYEENPLDNSYEGIIARYSGLDKETVSDILYIARYYNFVNNYDASERYAFGAPVVEMKEELRFDNESNVAKNLWGILVEQISYADVRNRSFAV